MSALFFVGISPFLYGYLHHMRSNHGQKSFLKFKRECRPLWKLKTCKINKMGHNLILRWTNCWKLTKQTWKLLKIWWKEIHIELREREMRSAWTISGWKTFLICKFFNFQCFNLFFLIFFGFFIFQAWSCIWFKLTALPLSSFGLEVLRNVDHLKSHSGWQFFSPHSSRFKSSRKSTFQHDNNKYSHVIWCFLQKLVT